MAEALRRGVGRHGDGAEDDEGVRGLTLPEGTTPQDLKRAAGRSAAGIVESGMALGLGTGSTVQFFLEALAERIERGEVASVRGVPTSVRTADACNALGIPLTSLTEDPRLDLAVDGADEVDPELRLIKGLGGALLREKMVAEAAGRFVVIADDSKRVQRLGSKAPLPVEVVPFEWGCHVEFLRSLGGEPTLRTDADETPYRTDNGNFILDCRFADGIADAEALDRTLAGRAGIVDHGLFLGLAQEAHLAGTGGVEILRRRP